MRPSSQNDGNTTYFADARLGKQLSYGHLAHPGPEVSEPTTVRNESEPMRHSVLLHAVVPLSNSSLERRIMTTRADVAVLVRSPYLTLRTGHRSRVETYELGSKQNHNIAERPVVVHRRRPRRRDVHVVWKILGRLVPP